MSDSVYVGKNVSELTRNYIFSPITKVVIEVDNETTYTAGNDTGRTLTVSCPWGTQAMANNILSSVSGYTYQPYEGTEALLNPAAEIGDAITIGGLYSVIVNTEITYDGLCLTSVSAPEDEEVDSEYPYLPPIERKISAAQTAAGNAQTAAGNAQSTADNALGTANDALDTAGDALDAANEADSKADAANNQIVAWSYPGSSIQIDGANIKADTIMATKLLGGTVGLLNASEAVAGELNITGSSSGSFAIELASGGALRLVADSGAVYIGSSGGASFQLLGNATCGAPLIPQSSAVYSLGNSSFLWSQLYAATSVISTSDRNKKTDIDYDLTKYQALYDKLRPVSYKFRDGTSGRTHTGFISQDVEEALIDSGISGTDFGGFCKDKNEESGGYDYALRYEEFIALNTWKIKQLESRINELEQRLEALNG